MTTKETESAAGLAVAGNHEAVASNDVMESTPTPTSAPPPPQPTTTPAPPIKFTLSSLTLADTEAFLALRNEDGTYQWMAQGDRMDRTAAERFLRFCESDETASPASRENYYWGVRVAAPSPSAITPSPSSPPPPPPPSSSSSSSSSLAGYVGVHTVKYNRGPKADRRQFYVSFVIATAFRGQRLGPRALQQAIALFHAARPDVASVYADVHEGNGASDKALRHAGFAPLLVSGTHELMRVPVGKKMLLRMSRPVVIAAGAGAGAGAGGKGDSYRQSSDSLKRKYGEEK